MTPPQLTAASRFRSRPGGTKLQMMLDHPGHRCHRRIALAASAYAQSARDESEPEKTQAQAPPAQHRAAEAGASRPAVRPAQDGEKRKGGQGGRAIDLAAVDPFRQPHRRLLLEQATKSMNSRQFERALDILDAIDRAFAGIQRSLEQAGDGELHRRPARPVAGGYRQGLVTRTAAFRSAFGARHDPARQGR